MEIFYSYSSKLSHLLRYTGREKGSAIFARLWGLRSCLSIHWYPVLQIVIGVLWVFFFMPAASHGGGPVHGSKAAGMGTAFTAVADDPSAILQNPAGLTQLKGTHIYGGATVVSPSTEYKGPSGESEETEFQVFFPPHFYISSDLNQEKIAVGLGIYSPFGVGGRKWRESGPIRYISTESYIATVAVNPVFAWQVSPVLSIGGGVFYLHSFSSAERRTDQSMFGTEDGKFSMDADGGGWGFNVGVLIKPSDRFSLGFAYRSHTALDQSGDIELENIADALQPAFGGSRFKTRVESTVDFPEIFSAGIAYKPIETLTLAFDIEWAGWSRFDKQILNLENEVPAAGFTDTTIVMDWNDTWLIKFGLEYVFKEGFAFRTGYAYVQTPVPEHTLSPASPDADGHNLSVGFGYRKGKWVIDTFYIANFFENRTVNNNILSGKYENFTHFIGWSIGYRF